MPTPCSAEILSSYINPFLPPKFSFFFFLYFISLSSSSFSFTSWLPVHHPTTWLQISNIFFNSITIMPFTPPAPPASINTYLESTRPLTAYIPAHYVERKSPMPHYPGCYSSPNIPATYVGRSNLAWCPSLPLATAPHPFAHIARTMSNGQNSGRMSLAYAF